MKITYTTRLIGWREGRKERVQEGATSREIVCVYVIEREGEIVGEIERERESKRHIDRER